MPHPCVKRSLLILPSVFLMALLTTACEQPHGPTSADPLAPTESIAAAQSEHAIGSPKADREFYLARIVPVEGERVRGTAQFEIVGDWFTAKVRVTGLAPGERAPQHIHFNPTCEDAGGALINLDEDLTVGGEGAIAGDAYPRANRAGVLQYDARRPLTELEDALQEQFGFGIDELDLGARTVNIHEPLPQPIPPVGCGAIERIN